MKKLLSGNEAMARGIYEASVKVASAYPGTPSTEILENLVQYPGIYAEWAPNEKVAVEVALGAAIAGVRAVCAMKHVGVNVAADPIFTASYTGINGGLVIISADDPSMHSSQNEQDNRHYARAAKIPMFEPADSQDCLDMMREAFELSEKFDCPVFLRTTTRVCHSKSLVTEGKPLDIPIKEYARDIKKYIATPATAIARRPLVKERMKKLEEYANTCAFNRLEINENEIGVICSGIAVQYAREVFPPGTSFLQLGFTYPLPADLIRAFADQVKKIYVIEELDPFLEEQIKALGIEVTGKELIPDYFELNPQILRSAIWNEEPEGTDLDLQPLPRPPVLCPGCPHRSFFYTVARTKNTIIAGDIGCYSLGSADPLLAMDTVICMGGGFTIAMGMAKAFATAGLTDKKIFGVMGDSTFFHSGITGAIEIIYNQGNVIPVILDNHITAMTGQQDHPGTGLRLSGETAEVISIPAIMEAVGFKKILRVNPQDLQAMQDTVAAAISATEPTAIIVEGPCLLIKREKSSGGACVVNKEECTSCKICLRVGCPALYFKENKSYIDPVLCVGCTICMQVCPFEAIEIDEDYRHDPS
ncbi:MAG TPA: indolepyruvate ferredoxin oxidoreductase subunit alpha [Clostridiaceae bacterium]|nr:indolepyruvate ferredoxin oxidoreductase subunit alpha [Clostridiaceae bacterium]